jgi:hypothetical protein
MLGDAKEIEAAARTPRIPWTEHKEIRLTTQLITTYSKLSKDKDVSIIAR